MHQTYNQIKWNENEVQFKLITEKVALNKSIYYILFSFTSQ